MRGREVKAGAVGAALAAAVAAACALAVAPPAAAAEPVVSARDALEPALVKRINRVRAAHGLRRVRPARRLTKAATKHANSMGRAGYFRHELYTAGGDWTPFGTWIRWYYPGPGFSSWSAGENLAWGAPRLRPRRTVRMWMRSPGHRANILTPGWRQIGVAAVKVSEPAGAYGSHDAVTIWVAEFGRRSG